MDPRELDGAFEELAKRRGVDLTVSEPAVGVQMMLRFYADLRAEGCDLEADEDMLLFQWGTYDWGEGKHFELDITRQVILPDQEDDDAIWQLHVTYRFTPTNELARLGQGNRWCSSPGEIETFTDFVRGTPAFSAVAHRKPQEVRILYECAG